MTVQAGMELQTRPVTGSLLVMLLLLGSEHCLNVSAASKNRCDQKTVLITRTDCHSCSMSSNVGCPAGYNRRSNGKGDPNCKYHVSTTATQVLSISGCSHECFKELMEPRCCPGYWGMDCIECPQDTEGPCSNHGMCSEGMGGNGTCICKPGFVGTACEDCADNLYGPTCSSACKCVHGLCRAGIHGDGKCTCFSGYKGQNCDLELPECSALKCPENTRCIQSAIDGVLRCQCLPGHQTIGDQCISINPCMQQVCHVHATCAHVGPNKHLCTCTQGYSGDGHVCVPIDPCQTHQGGCSDDSARCVYDGPGKSHCECQDGFDHLAGGVSCSRIDVCKPASCSKNANCSTVEPNVVECTCHKGYLGNGKICYGNIMQRLNDLNTEPRGQWTGQLSNAITFFGAISWPLSNLGPFTVFVPTNKGFKGTLLNTLMADQLKAKYLCNLHIVAGEMPYDTLKRGDIYYTLTGKSGETVTTEDDKQLKIRIHGSRKKGDVLQSDVIASNGIIHIISKLMDSVPPTVESNKKENLMKIISDYGKFSKFKDLLMKTEVDLVLKQNVPCTVFAPANTAFDEMKVGELDYLTSTEGSAKRLAFVRNHVVPSYKLDVYNAVSSQRTRTMANHMLSFNVSENGQILVNGKAVLEAEVEANYGCLYSLDGVLIPPSIEPILPNRCDITENKLFKGDCVSCMKVTKSSCSSGVSTNTFVRDCVFRDMGFNIPTFGCRLVCNSTITTPLCCKGFFGPDCSPCPGGFKNPCSGHGQCSEGIQGNGTCACETNFKGSRCHYCSDPNKYGPACTKTCDCIHGVCDNRPEADGRCKIDSCRPGYTGTHCERQTKPCGMLVTFCHAHAVCDFTGGSVKCVCKPGFQGDGIKCADTDPCALPYRGGCDLNAKCIKTGPGSHTCQCLEGWKADEDGCQPINNCLGPDRGGCHPNASCIHVGPGQSSCACNRGFRGNGIGCEANNPCVTQNGSCHILASCLYISGAWTCVCDDGYTGNGELCYGTMGQVLSLLPDVAEFAKWIMDTDMNLLPTQMGENITVLVPSTAAIDKMNKDDKKYWTTQGNLPSMIKNHMILGIYSLVDLRNTSLQITSLLKKTLSVTTTDEITVVGGATITTANVASTNGMIHIIDRVLVPERRLSEGLLEKLGQRPEFSLFRSFLILYNLTDEIEPASAYTVFAPTDSAILAHLKNTALDTMELNTTKYHIILSEKLMSLDMKGGTYKESMLGFSYQLGILPRDGKLFVNEALVNVSDIQTDKGVIHGLSAVMEIIKNRCDNQQIKTIQGTCQDCFFPKEDLCPTGSTLVKFDKRKCVFSTVFQGEPLRGIGCRTICKITTIMRKCCGGFYGEHCEQCPGPNDHPCYQNGLCQDGINGTGVCQCNKGFNGTACETCQVGKYGIHCDQDCKCDNGRCNDGINGDGTCECDAYWRGVTCNERFNKENCGDRKCHTSAICVLQIGIGNSCKCLGGFEGNGTVCKAKDACQENNGGCSSHAMCKRTLPGRRQCVCLKGYHGDGMVCVSINPCLDGNGGCHVNAHCIHTGPNKTSCVCSQGYKGDGKESCTAINLCLKKNGECHRHARCNMTGPGERSCECMAEYVGNGIMCKGTVATELLIRRLRNFYMIGLMAGISLKARGPFTVFAPTNEAFTKAGKELQSLIKTGNGMNFFYYHIVSCHTLLTSDLTMPRNLTTLTGDVLTISYSEGVILINNNIKVVDSDDPSTNGIIHVIDTVMMPENLKKVDVIEKPMNLTDVADRYGYKTFYKLLEASAVMDMVNDPLHQPITIFLPSDQAMDALPEKQKDFLYDTQNQGHLIEYLKYHIIQQIKVYAAELVHMDPIRTLQGSELKANCGGMDKIGEIFFNNGNCRIIQRHLPFIGGIAYGIDCLLDPPSLGGRCDKKETVDIPLRCGFCSSTEHCPPGSTVKEVKKCDMPSIVSLNKGCQYICTFALWQPKCCDGFYGRDCLVCPGRNSSPCFNHGKCDDGSFGNGTCTCDAGFQGVACELCKDGHYGPDCKVCNCTEHGSCEDGLKGSGSCFCDQGWTGKRCETQQVAGLVCSPACSSNGVCKENNTCVCKPHYEGDGVICTVANLCKYWNGGCANGATCSQKGEKVICTCPKGHSGDGFFCQPIDPCSIDDNGGCHEHAICTMTGPGKRKCACKENYIGDGKTCEVKELPMNRCLQENEQCHSDAHCTDLHYEDSTLGVFHYRSTKGQYRLNYTSAQSSCIGEGGTIATYTQLSYAQQAGYNLCVAGWLDQARVAYPITYSNPKCGFGHVGIVDYGIRSNLSETWDAYCYRAKEVKCECKTGYIGDGYSCTGNLLQVLSQKPTLSNFLSQILNYSQNSGSGKQFINHLSNLTIQSTLFVPDNSGLYPNQTLTDHDIEYHLVVGRSLALKDLTNGSRIRTRLGPSITVLGIADFLNPKSLSTSRYINDRFVIDSDILASNGIIHVLQGPLKAPPPKTVLPESHKAGMGIGVMLLILLIAGTAFVGYHFYTHNTKPFQFHYFKEDEDETPPDCNPAICNPSIVNPIYDSAPTPSEPGSSEIPVKQQAVESGPSDLLQDSQLTSQ